MQPDGNHYNLLALPQVHRPVFTRTFTDSDFPGLEITLTLRRPSPVQECEIVQTTQEETARWVTGDQEAGTPALPFIIGEKAVGLHARFIANVCLIWGMQAEKVLTVHQLLALFHEAWNMYHAVDAWAMDILRGRAEEPGKSPGAPQAPSSSSGSTTSTPTPDSSSAPTVSSGASTSD